MAASSGLPSARPHRRGTASLDRIAQDVVDGVVVPHVRATEPHFRNIRRAVQCDRGRVLTPMELNGWRRGLGHTHDDARPHHRSHTHTHTRPSRVISHTASLRHESLVTAAPPGPSLRRPPCDGACV